MLESHAHIQMADLCFLTGSKYYDCAGRAQHLCCGFRDQRWWVLDSGLRGTVFLTAYSPSLRAKLDCRYVAYTPAASWVGVGYQDVGGWPADRVCVRVD